MKVIDGELTVLLPKTDEWKTFSAGEEFTVPANASFIVKTTAQSAYLCSYR